MNSVRVDGAYIGKAKNLQQASIAQRTEAERSAPACSDRSWFFGTGHAACVGAMSLVRQWGRLNRHGHCGVVLASGNRFDGLIASMASALNRVPLNDLAALNAAVDSHTVAIIIEPAHGDAATVAYLQGAQSLCRALNILLLINETQHRAGQWTTSPSEEACDVRADIVILANCLDGAVPTAALLARGQACVAEQGELPGSGMSMRPTLAFSQTGGTRKSSPRGLLA